MRMRKLKFKRVVTSVQRGEAEKWDQKGAYKYNQQKTDFPT